MNKERSSPLHNVLRNNSAGTTLVEVLVALALLGLVAAIFLSGMATGSRGTVADSEQAIAESLARSELEYAKSLPYTSAPGSYAVDPGLDVPSGWTVSPVSATAIHSTDDGIQALAVTVTRNGRAVLALNTYRTSR